jgi:hypothetical protein
LDGLGFFSTLDNSGRAEGRARDRLSLFWSRGCNILIVEEYLPNPHPNHFVVVEDLLVQAPGLQGL